MRFVQAIFKLFALCITIVEATIDFAFRALSARRPLTIFERTLWLHQWSRKLLGRWDVVLRSEGMMPATGVVASNHLGYMDVLIFSASGPCVFVSKSDVRSWPVFGRLARIAGTIFVDRMTAKDVCRVNRQIEKVLRHGATVVIFPEGTSSDGSTVLPFRSALFESTIRSGTSLTPAYVSYELKGGSVERDLCYWGDMLFASHLLKLLLKGHIEACVRFGDKLRGIASRKEAASLARESVAYLAGNA